MPARRPARFRIEINAKSHFVFYDLPENELPTQKIKKSFIACFPCCFSEDSPTIGLNALANEGMRVIQQIPRNFDRLANGLKTYAGRSKTLHQPGLEQPVERYGTDLGSRGRDIEDACVLRPPVRAFLAIPERPPPHLARLCAQQVRSLRDAVKPDAYESAIHPSPPASPV